MAVACLILGSTPEARRNSSEIMDRETRDSAIIRDLLERIDETPEVNQRSLSQDLGIALGMTNAYLKRCVKKGWVKLGQVPARRYRYYLTPRGFAEKSRLTAEYFSDSLVFFRRARESFDHLYDDLESQDVGTIVLCGADEMTEIGVLCAHDRSLDVIGILRNDGAGDAVRGIAAIDRDDLPTADIYVIATSRGTQEIHQTLCETVGQARVRYPEVLGKVIGGAS
jgi:DNA-binding MarR family transcriptional regulator